jgi:hypothetical protein
MNAFATPIPLVKKEVVRMEHNNISLPVRPDEWKINMNDAWQVLWWCRYLGLTKSQLELAINAVGPVIMDLKNYLTYENISYSGITPKNAPKGGEHISLAVGNQRTY